MHSSSTPALVTLDPDWSITTLLDDRLARQPEGILAERRHKPDGPWEKVTTAQFDELVRQVAKGLIAHGIGPGERVGIMGRTSFAWTVLDYAAWSAGAVPVPIYETSSVEQIQWICTDAKVKLLVVETVDHAVLAEDASAELPDLLDVLVIAQDALDELVRDGKGISDEVLDERRAAVKLDDLATLIYTSGTTGKPKGVELTHRAFVSIVKNASDYLARVVAGPDKRTLIFLPLAHVFARFLQVLAVSNDGVIGHTSDIKQLIPDLASFQPTYLLAVPRVFEKVYNSAAQKAGRGLKKRIFTWSARVAITYSRALEGTKSPSGWLSFQHRVAGVLVYKKLQTLFGGQLDYAISGGAPLGEQLGHFFRGIGLIILEGYGLTETTAPLSVNVPEKIKIGTVGPAVASVELKLSAEGEILARADSVFNGYHNNPQATAEAFVDGWFRTGDLGSIDEDGYLRITGRMKEIIVTAGGKNVAPSGLEDPLRAHVLISQCVVVGDQRPFIGALLTLDSEMLASWLANRGLPSMTIREAAAHPAVLAAIQGAVDRTNAKVSKAESIRKFTVLEQDFTEANGYLTPSLKVRRSLVLRDFAKQIDELYQQ